MPAEVETMGWYGKRPWHGLGVEVETPDAAALFRAAELDWMVNLVDLQTVTGAPVPHFLGVQRSDTDAVIAVVGERYTPVQNYELLDTLAPLQAAGVEWQVAGSLREGQQVVFCGRLPDQTILGDTTEFWLTLRNDHTGRSALTFLVSPVRVVCMNTLTAALRSARQQWTVRHTKSVAGRLEWATDQVRQALGLAETLNAVAEGMATAPYDREQYDVLVCDYLVPVLERETETRRRLREQLRSAIYADDLADFRWTRWGAFQAVAAVASHEMAYAPGRGPRLMAQERRWRQFMEGDPLTLKAFALLTE